MSAQSWSLLGLFLCVLAVTVKPMGAWIAAVMQGESHLVKVSLRIENFVLRLCGTRADADIGWRAYDVAVLVFSMAGAALLYLQQRVQLWLPLNPQQLGNISLDSLFNTAISFVTNTNWQSYVGEATMSYFIQMTGLGLHNFLSAATGIAVVFALVLVIQGAIQNFKSYAQAKTLEVTKYQQPKLDAAGQQLKDAKGNPVLEDAQASEQTIPMVPVASQEAIKMLGTNGGGFFNANSAHPNENPTPLANFLQILAIFLIPAGLCQAFGRAVGDALQGWAVLGAMTAIFFVMAWLGMAAEHAANPMLHGLNLMQDGGLVGNWESKETRFGIDASALFAAVTTAASCGAVNAMHDSLSALGGLVPLWLIQLGEVVFGGVGSGLYGMLVFAILAVFIAGLMIGRKPEYLGKKIEAYDMKMVALAILVTLLLVLAGTAASVLLADGRAGILNPGAHGFTEILYALSSAANKNGSALVGLSANTPYYNSLLGVVMWLGRFAIIVPVLAVAGSLAAKKRIEPGAGTMSTHGLLFASLLTGTVLIVGATTYIPALALEPVVEHLSAAAAAAR
ncbi:MAG: potassium-transporting ATPase subunit KdpA [Candidatus Protistobacter heckmanni]|nr:potassium-transporting ATPase subunit KdpA [Candidatus Protistobacter heckmanni]